MNRRTALQALLLASGGLATLPSWAMRWRPTDLAGTASVFSSTEHQLLAAVADTILPAGDEIGALSVGVDQFLPKLFSQCYDADVQASLKTQLRALDTAARQAHGVAFPACSQTQRETLLNRLAASADEEEKAFFDLMKSETMRGFTTSEEVMVKYLGYRVIPTYYHGCVDVNS
ncbi:Gluconate 2-dehydrogenase subunit 3 [Catalinimonas alkaloidigena]|uniref:Gluconate 2-dehydrogenase subunit 3 n=1 Tax=Catalinimonas alkaloidigena TaxID=1075417 RepID=A0A1G9AXX4_9BACT|nr:gluconate 2-dehydrogenase subunit 3 family protein [Catalinimonas alkaloidigena]SDK32087.1 Gluconate 2-dehydrogenase subunit 3 [Catalinimonas alkaloidigena]